MTNRELQDLLKQYPDDAEVRIECHDYEGDEWWTAVENVFFYDHRIIIVAD